MFVYVALVDMMVKYVLIVAHWELDCVFFFCVYSFVLLFRCCVSVVWLVCASLLYFADRVFYR